MAMERSPSSRAALLFLALALAPSVSYTNSHGGPAAAAAAAAPVAARCGPANDGDAPITVIALTVQDDDVAALAVDAHDLSLAGFCNRSGHWYAFPGYGHVLDPSKSTLLPFGNTYHDLIGGLDNLPGLPLGRGPTLWAAGALSAYDAAAADADAVAALKRALATLKVTTVEDQRLRPVGEAAAKGYDSGDARVGPELLPYIEYWDIICYELIRARRSGEWGGGPFTELLRENANIRGEEEALAVVGDLVVNRTLGELLVAHARSA